MSRTVSNTYTSRRSLVSLETSASVVENDTNRLSRLMLPNVASGTKAQSPIRSDPLIPVATENFREHGLRVDQQNLLNRRNLTIIRGTEKLTLPITPGEGGH